MLIYTIGTSNRSLQEFIELLKYYKIQLLVDIRRFPTSKFLHFKRENLEEGLKKENIGYFYLGKELGGFRKEGYLEYMKKEEFKVGIEKLIELAKDKTIALCCSEKLAFRCHRRFISSVLRDKGFKVIHIVEKEKSISF